MTAKQGTPSRSQRWGAALVDFFLAALFAWVFVNSLNLTYVLTSVLLHPFLVVPGFVATIALAWALARGERALLGRSAGQAVWRIPPQGSDAPAEGVSPGPRIEARSASSLPAGIPLVSAIVLTLTGPGVAVLIFREFVLTHPVLLVADSVSHPPFWPTGLVPDPGAENPDWAILPWFYAMGAWPRQYGRNPAVHSIAYEKGPPERFVGKISAYWDAPEIRVTAEGPKTATRFEERALIRDCLVSPARTLACLGVRARALDRHVSEMQRRLDGGTQVDWKLEWFQVLNSEIPEAERPEGFSLRARADGRIQERYVLINPKGAHQAFILERPESAPEASELLASAIRSMRMGADLAPGRSLAELALSRISLREILAPRDLSVASLAGSNPSEPGADRVRRLIAAHTLLLAKVSVDPTSFDAFYHLAGSTLLLLREAARNPEARIATAGLKNLVQAAWKHGADVGPGDRRLPELENLWIEARKY